VDADSPKLYRLGRGSVTWEEVGFTASGNDGYSRFQSIYGETNHEGKPVPGSDNLYVGASKGPSKDGKHYAVFHTDGTTRDLSRLKSDTGALTGAAYDGTNHYFSTDGDGVYSSTSPSGGFVQVTNTADLVVNGLIRITSGEIIALCKTGDLYKLNGGTADKLGNAGVELTGPAAVWTPDGTTYLLLAAVRSSSSSTSSIYGYRELVIPSGGLVKDAVTMKEPGGNTPSTPSTMEDNNLYHSTIEPKPVNAIFQAPSEIDSGRTLFASVRGRGTAKDNTDGGVWSYRNRNGVSQWNAEE
jgi:hypothetical protein